MTTPTLSSALDLFLLEDRAPSTRRTYHQVLSRAIKFFGPDRDIDLVSHEDILRYLAHLREQNIRYADHPTRPIQQGGLSAKTIEKYVKTLTAFFGWACERGYRGDNPASNLKLRRSQRPPGDSKAATPAELQAMLRIAEAKALLGKPLHLALLVFLADTGSRAGEAASLTLGNLLLDEHGAWVQGKGDKVRPVFFGEKTASILRLWLSHLPDAGSSTSVFNMTAPAISQAIRRMSKAAGLKRSLGSHAIRHRVGQVWQTAKMGEQATQLKLGHDNPTVTIQMYYNTTWDQVAQASEDLALAAIYGLPSEPPRLTAPTNFFLRRKTS
jgi:integrase